MTPSTTKTTNKIPPLETDAGQWQLPVRFLEPSWPSSLVHLAWPFQRLVVSIPELRDHHQDFLSAQPSLPGIETEPNWPSSWSETNLPPCRILLLGLRDIQRESDPQSGVQPPPPQSQIMSPSTVTTAHPAWPWPVIQDLTNPFCLSMTHVSSD